MNAILAALVAAQLTMYEAKVVTFGCNSNEAASELQHMRGDKDGFAKRLQQQMFLGECIEIAKGTVIGGSVMPTNSQLLVVGEQVDPPGYLAPLEDFEPKPTATK
jgi:hypothetical protein